MTKVKWAALCAVAVALPTIGTFAYQARRPVIHQFSVRLAAAKPFQLPSGAAFPGVVVLQEHFTGCSLATSCTGTPVLRSYKGIRSTGESTETIWEMTTPDQFRTRFLNVQGKYVEIRSLVQAKMTFHGLRKTDINDIRANRLDPMSKCQATMAGEPGFASFTKPATSDHLTINGASGPVLTYVFDTESPSASARKWYAPDYGCVEVQAEYHWKDSKAPNATTLVRTTALYLMAPDESNFVDPEDCDEVRPTELIKRTFLHNATLNGKNEGEALTAWAQRLPARKAELEQLDRAYLDNRARAGLKN